MEIGRPDADQFALYEKERRVGVIRDAVRDVVLRIHSGLYLYGPAGNGKTTEVRNTLGSVGASYHYHTGHLTPLGYFDLLKRYPDEVLVIDDVNSLFRNPIGQQMLLASLDSGYGENRVRIVRYHERNRTEEVCFTGGLIAISNRELHDSDEMCAIKSRTRPRKWNPSDAELAATMRDAVRNGWTRSGAHLTAAECHEVLNFLLTECRQSNVSLDLRLFFDGALPDCAASKAGDHEIDWRDHTTIAVRERVGRLQHSGPPLTRDALKRLEQKIAEKIRASYNTRAEQVEAWYRETGKSDRAFDRRTADLRIAK